MSCAKALRASHLPLDKTLETFERKRLPRKIDTLVNVLIEGSFLDRCENGLAFGQPGSGKTHLLCAIGLELIYAERRVLFRRCDVLVQELLAAKCDLILPRLLKQWGRFDALLIDDLGREEMEVLFNLLAHRYERGSVMITINLPFSRWEKIFKDPMTTAAAMDRLVHHSVILRTRHPQLPAGGVEETSCRLTGQGLAGILTPTRWRSGGQSGSQASTLLAVSGNSRIRGPTTPRDGKDDASPGAQPGCG